MRTRGFLCVALLISVVTRANASEHTLPVEVARSEAVEASRAGRWGDALVAINKAVALEPTWSELYFLRAGIHVGNAGPDSDAIAMLRVRRAANYTQMVTEFAAAADDWEKYLQMDPKAKERKTLLQAIGEYRARAGAAKDLADRLQKMLAREAAYAAGTPAVCEFGRELVATTVGTSIPNPEKKLHCCWKSQRYDGYRCIDSCPTGFEQKGTSNGSACVPPIVRLDRGATSRCAAGTREYAYAPSFWDEDVERYASYIDSMGSQAKVYRADGSWLAVAGALDALVSTRVGADRCQFLGSPGLYCCP